MDAESNMASLYLKRKLDKRKSHTLVNQNEKRTTATFTHDVPSSPTVLPLYGDTREASGWKRVSKWIRFPPGAMQIVCNTLESSKFANLELPQIHMSIRP
jgi:hypothetical protein